MASRNTPTGVGKTLVRFSVWHDSWKHPHGRGEDEAARSIKKALLETPPRAWGRLGLVGGDDNGGGNTPTGVGKTIVAHGWILLNEKHPHGRGEDPVASCSCRNSAETPPRAWGRLLACLAVLPLFGNTPTGVGKTRLATRWPRSSGKHPHGRGEDGRIDHGQCGF